MSAAERFRGRLRCWLEAKEHLAGGIARQREFTERYSVLREVDLLLNGADGARRSAKRLRDGGVDPNSLIFLQDDPAWVAEATAATPNAPLVASLEARLAFLGGRPALRTLTERLSESASESQDQASARRLSAAHGR